MARMCRDVSQEGITGTHRIGVITGTNWGFQQYGEKSIMDGCECLPYFPSDHKISFVARTNILHLLD